MEGERSMWRVLDDVLGAGSSGRGPEKSQTAVDQAEKNRRATQAGIAIWDGGVRRRQTRVFFWRGWGVEIGIRRGYRRVISTTAKLSSSTLFGPREGVRLLRRLRLLPPPPLLLRRYYPVR